MDVQEIITKSLWIVFSHIPRGPKVKQRKYGLYQDEGDAIIQLCFPSALLASHINSLKL